nr:retrovirus-related Pol polyprotein from transposon opus [Tanacetum cinerariifolium]
MDDLSIFGDSFDKCLNNRDKMLQCCKDAHPVLNWDKYHFIVKEGNVLGHKMSGTGLEFDKAKINVISKLPPPTNIKGSLEDIMRLLQFINEGYRNTIELPEGNNVVPLRSDTIRLVKNGFSFHGLRSEDPNNHFKDFLKLVDSFDLDVANRERTRLQNKAKEGGSVNSKAAEYKGHKGAIEAEEEVKEERKDEFEEEKDTTSVINHYLGGMVLGKAFVKETGLVYDKDEGTVKFQKEGENIIFKMPHKLEMFKHIEKDILKTDNIPSFIITGNDFNQKKTHYFDRLNLGPAYGRDESTTRCVETTSENSATLSGLSSDRVRIVPDCVKPPEM